MRTHVVSQGEYLRQIAYRYGVTEDAIWQDAKNADLRERRTSPQVLMAGDILFIPDPQRRPERFTHESSNTFQVEVPRTHLKLVFGSELAGAAYRIEGTRQALTGSADGSGLVEVDVPVTLRSIQVSFPANHRTFRIAIGELDPVTEPTGVATRLSHLGYLEPGQAADEDTFVEAVVKFQSDRGLSTTGAVDDDTRSALEQAHGS